jgi:hypothetical protein
MAASLKPISSTTAMKTLFLTTVAFAALVMIAPIGAAHADTQRIDPGVIQACVDGMRQFDFDNHRARVSDQTKKDTATCRKLIGEADGR